VCGFILSLRYGGEQRGQSKLKVENPCYRNPSQAEIEGGAKYLLEIHPGAAAEGEIRGADNALLRRFTAVDDFVLLDVEGVEKLRIRRKRDFPALFEIVHDGKPAGSIRRRGWLRNKYEVKISSGETWLFHMRLFTVLFYGLSGVGERVWIRMGPSKMQWSAVFQRGTENEILIGALAFIHHCWWLFA
jgi:hypothetical protein